MRAYWIVFTDGQRACCEGLHPDDAQRIAEALTGKKVAIDPSSRKPSVRPLPYPAKPVIWRFYHPVIGATPTFCFRPDECAGRTSCPRDRACDD